VWGSLSIQRLLKADAGFLFLYSAGTSFRSYQSVTLHDALQLDGGHDQSQHKGREAEGGNGERRIGVRDGVEFLLKARSSGDLRGVRAVRLDKGIVGHNGIVAGHAKVILPAAHVGHVGRVGSSVGNHGGPAVSVCDHASYVSVQASRFEQTAEVFQGRNLAYEIGRNGGGHTGKRNCDTHRKPSVSRKSHRSDQQVARWSSVVNN